MITNHGNEPWIVRQKFTQLLRSFLDDGFLIDVTNSGKFGTYHTVALVLPKTKEKMYIGVVDKIDGLGKTHTFDIVTADADKDGWIGEVKIHETITLDTFQEFMNKTKGD